MHNLTATQFWAVWLVIWAGVLALAYGIGWGLTDCPRWFLPCRCGKTRPRRPRRLRGVGTLWRDALESLPSRARADRTQAYASNPGGAAGELQGRGIDAQLDGIWLAELERINRARLRDDIDLSTFTAEQVDAWLATKPLERPDWIGRSRGAFAFLLELPVELTAA